MTSGLPVGAGDLGTAATVPPPVASSLPPHAAASTDKAARQVAMRNP
jgi:hypothetical protein